MNSKYSIGDLSRHTTVWNKSPQPAWHFLKWFRNQCRVGEARSLCRTPPACRQALIQKCIVLLCNAWWVTQKPLTHPTLGLSKHHSSQPLFSPSGDRHPPGTEGKEGLVRKVKCAPFNKGGRALCGGIFRYAVIRLLIAAAPVLLLTGCAFFKNPKDTAGDTQGEESAPLILWEEIDGGAEGNIVTGVAHIRFMRPVAVAARGNFIYVVDAGQNLLYRYARDFGKLTVLKDLKAIVAGEVTDLYVDRDLSFYITDTDGGRVLHFDREGNQIQIFEDRRNLARPVSITVDEVTGQILIADSFNDDVLVYNRLGILQGAIGTRGTETGEFMNITAITEGPDGVYVAARLGHRVQLMSHDGTYLKSFQENTVTFPLAIVVDQDRRAFVGDYMDDTIKVYADGLLVDKIGGSGAGPGRFKRITDMWLDEGLLYVADSMNGRIQVARIMPAPIAQEPKQ